MKKSFYNRLLIVVGLSAIVFSCKDDEGPDPLTADFRSIASSYYEKDGTKTVIIPFRNADAGFAGSVDVSLGGTATEGEDYTFNGVTSEGIELSLIDDDKREATETVRVQISPTNGNAIHTVTIESNCEDEGGLDKLGYMEGDWAALEVYCDPGCTYGPYDIHLIQDATDPNKFTFDNFYDSGCDAYMIFDIVAGTVYFPDQAPCGEALTASSGTFSLDLCADTKLTINLNFDGGDWVYKFTKL